MAALPTGTNGIGAPADRERPSAEALDALEAKLVWVLGSPRTGSSWFRRLLDECDELVTINETYLGSHLVPISETGLDGEHFETGVRARDPHYFFASDFVNELRPDLRRLLLNGLWLQADRLAAGREFQAVAIKEPNGSHAADTIISLLPGSRMIFLCRDGRDVLDSVFDALHGHTEESWWDEIRGSYHMKEKVSELDPAQRTGFIRNHSRLWISRTAATQRAFAMLPPERRLLVRYEDLLADTAAQLERIYDWLGIEVGAEELAAVADKHDFFSLPPEQRGPGKEVRTATPGLWRQNFSAEEQALMNELLGPKLRDLGYED